MKQIVNTAPQIKAEDRLFDFFCNDQTYNFIKINHAKELHCLQKEPEKRQI
jgi:hypothetical protein